MSNRRVLTGGGRRTRVGRVETQQIGGAPHEAARIHNPANRWVCMSKGFSWLFVIAGAVLILLEVVIGAASGFDFLLIGSAILLGGLLGLVTGSPAAGVATAGVLSLLYIFVGRRKIRSRLQGHTGTASNVDALLGRTVRVTERIEGPHAGRVKLEGEEWRAQLDQAGAGPLEPGQNARVTRIDGVTAYVVPLGE